MISFRTGGDHLLYRMSTECCFGDRSISPFCLTVTPIRLLESPTPVQRGYSIFFRTVVGPFP